MSFRRIDYKKICDESLAARKTQQRSQEDIIADLTHEIERLEPMDFITEVQNALIQSEDRELPIFDNLESPMRQLTYLIDVYFSINHISYDGCSTRSKWHTITKYLDEIEKSYFYSIAFYDTGDTVDDDYKKKILISLSAFTNHFYNGRLTFDEQVLDRIERLFKPYDDFIYKNFGFRIDDALSFIYHMRSLFNERYMMIAMSGASLYSLYNQSPDEIDEIATELYGEDKLFLEDLRLFMQINPAEMFVQPSKVLKCEEIGESENDALIKFFSFPQHTKDENLPYYTDTPIYSKHPLLILEDKVMIPVTKFLIDGLWHRLNEWLTIEKGEKYKFFKDVKLEEKVAKILKQLFGNYATIYTSYSVDGICEQDILVDYNGTFIIIEVKNCGFRDPIRNPVKGFSRIVRDFFNAIQKGYDQCRRVENALYGKHEVNVLDGHNFKKIKGIIKRDRIQAVYSIVVTEYRYGFIQTDLHNLLRKEDNAHYPWSVCVDDLESFILLLKKKHSTDAPERFLDYLHYRELFHSRLKCMDELELCGLYLCDTNFFKTVAADKPVFITTAGMSDIFDAYYQIGLGFENERDIDIKQFNCLPEYESSFEVKKIKLKPA